MFYRAKYGAIEQEYKFNIRFHEDKPVRSPIIEYPATSDSMKYKYPIVGQKYQFICKKVFHYERSKSLAFFIHFKI